MKNPNQKLLNEFTFNMIAFLEGAKVVDKEKRVIFLDGEFYHAEIRFYLGRVAEFTVKDRKSDEILYYLHFEMTDFDTIYYHISSFIHFLQGYRPGHRLPIEKKDKQQMEPLRIPCPIWQTVYSESAPGKNCIPKSGIFLPCVP